MRTSADYVKIVEWSEEDQCFVGSAPGLMYGGCHGDDEVRVFKELCSIVENVIEDALNHADTLPPPTAGQDLAIKLQKAS